MSYKVIEKNEYGVLVIDNDKHKSMSDICSQCKYCDICNDEWMECIINTYYLPDSEVEKLESENNLKAKNEALENNLKQTIIDFVKWYREDDMSSYTPEHLAEWYLKIKNQK